MFWKKPPKTPENEGKVPSRDALIKQATAGLAAARAELGDETIAKMKALALAQQEMQHSAQAPKLSDEQSPADRARALIKNMDKAKLADYIRATSRED